MGPINKHAKAPTPSKTSGLHEIKLSDHKVHDSIINYNPCCGDYLAVLMVLAGPFVWVLVEDLLKRLF